MKLKYYLRGLGIGILVTAVIMSVTNKPKEMTDAQIKMRARELGMVEESVLSDLQAKDELSDMAAVEEMLNEYTQEEENVEEVTETDEAEVITEEVTETEKAEVITEEVTETEKAEVITEEVAELEEAEVITEEVTETNKEVEETEESDKVDVIDEVIESFTVVKVERGNGSEVVSRRLYEAGLVESAVEYNQFLVKNGYDRRLSVGNHEIPAGASYEEMARILCGMK